MSRRIIEVYLAAVCFAVTISILLSAHSFFLSRRAAFWAKGDADRELAGLSASGGNGDRAPLDKAMKQMNEFGLAYESEREYLWFACAVLAGHVFLLVAAEVIFWRRSRRTQTAVITE